MRFGCRFSSLPQLCNYRDNIEMIRLVLFFAQTSSGVIALPFIAVLLNVESEPFDIVVLTVFGRCNCICRGYGGFLLCNSTNAPNRYIQAASANR